MKKYIINLIVLLLTLATGCEKFSLIGNDNKNVKATFCITTSNFSSLSTKAGFEVNENTIANLWILQFDGPNDNSLLTKSEYKESITDINSLELLLNAGTNQRVVFIANSFDSGLFNQANAPISSFTYSQFKNQKISVSDEASMFAGSTSNYLRMYGCYLGDVPNKESAIILYRICSKVHINYISEDVSSIEDGVRFRITSVQLKNVPASSSYISNPTNSTVFLPPSVIDYPVTTGTLIGTTEESYSIGDYTGSVTYYMPENIAGINSSVGSQILKSIYAPAKATYLELKGEGIGNDGRVNEYATFKFYLGNNLTTDYNVNSNTSYSFTVRFKGLNIKDMRLEIIRISDIEVIVEEEWI